MWGGLPARPQALLKPIPLPVVAETGLGQPPAQLLGVRALLRAQRLQIRAAVPQAGVHHAEQNHGVLGQHGLSPQSARRPGHVPAGQDVEVEVGHGLPRLLPNVGDHAVALQPQLPGHLGDDGEHVAHQGGVVVGHPGHRGDVGLGDDQEVGGRLGVDVVEGVADLVLIDLAGRDLAADNLTEQAVGHG